MNLYEQLLCVKNLDAYSRPAQKEILERLAFDYYVREGFVPGWLEAIQKLAAVAPAGFKFNPNHDELGRFTFGSGDNDDDKDPDAITPVYPLETLLLTLLPGGRLLSAWRALAEEAGALTEGESAVEWVLGNFKSAQRWANQIADRNWTPQNITDTIENGDQYPAPNNVNPGNTATRYQNPETGRFIVRDDITKEILQISGPGFIPDTIPEE